VTSLDLVVDILDRSIVLDVSSIITYLFNTE